MKYKINMDRMMDIFKALADETRVRAVMALRGGELCVCQLIELLDLAPSTVSRHLSILKGAGLIAKRKRGRWHYYRRAAEDAPEAALATLAWLDERLGDDAAVVADSVRLREIQQVDPEDLCRKQCGGKDPAGVEAVTCAPSGEADRK